MTVAGRVSSTTEKSPNVTKTPLCSGNTAAPSEAGHMEVIFVSRTIGSSTETFATGRSSRLTHSRGCTGAVSAEEKTLAEDSLP